MNHAPMQRRLAAILASDVVGYSRKIRLDEAGTLSALKTLWANTFDPAVTQYRGRIFKSMGDGKLVEFASAVDAVRCAIAIQEMSDTSSLVLRIGVHVGDVVIEGDDILGDGVNVAARLEREAPLHGILISDAVHDQIQGKIQASFSNVGALRLKNIDHPIKAWRWTAKATEISVATSPDKPLPSLAVLPFANLSNDPEQEFFVDGLVEDMITTLSKLSELLPVSWMLS
jgi:adenylate cyclase